MDYIHIENLRVRGKHGVTHKERNVEQEFEINLRLAVGSTQRAAHSDQLKDAVDYSPIKKMIVRVVEERSFYLIEKLAEVLAAEILSDERIESVELTIKKPEVWASGVPGLTIVRER